MRGYDSLWCRSWFYTSQARLDSLRGFVTLVHPRVLVGRSQEKASSGIGGVYVAGRVVSFPTLGWRRRHGNWRVVEPMERSDAIRDIDTEMRAREQ